MLIFPIQLKATNYTPRFVDNQEFVFNSFQLHLLTSLCPLQQRVIASDIKECVCRAPDTPYDGCCARSFHIIFEFCWFFAVCSLIFMRYAWIVLHVMGFVFIFIHLHVTKNYQNMHPREHGFSYLFFIASHW